MNDVDPEEQVFSQRKIRPSSPGPITNKTKRPWKGIWLTMFLFFCSILFMNVAVERYSELTGGEVATVLVLALLLLIPGGYFGFIILMAELGLSGFNYRMMPELSQW